VLYNLLTKCRIVAVTGLGGKAFASWQCEEGSMWLRDYLPLDVPNIRVSIYGYSSELANCDSMATISDFTNDFLLNLENSRLPRQLEPVRSPETSLPVTTRSASQQQRPLILIGHCLGGLIIKEVSIYIARISLTH
jgi:hypothetical protein